MMMMMMMMLLRPDDVAVVAGLGNVACVVPSYRASSILFTTQKARSFRLPFRSIHMNYIITIIHIIHMYTYYSGFNF
jgi:hypothetical protein